MCVNNDVKIASFFSAKIVKLQLYSYVKFMKRDKREKFNFRKITTVRDLEEFLTKIIYFLIVLFSFNFSKCMTNVN